MESKIPKTELEIELTFDKIILQKKVRNLQIHLSAALAVLKENNLTNYQSLRKKIPPT